MKFNKYLICALFLVLICCIGAASAADSDDVVAANDTIDEAVSEAVDVSDEIDEEPLGVSEEPALSDGGTPSTSEKVIYVGTNGTNGGDGSPENPFTTFKAARDSVNGEDTVNIYVYNGTYKLAEGMAKSTSPLIFNTNNLNIIGINGSVIIKNYFNEKSNCAEAFSLSSSSANFTFSNLIFDASGVTNTNIMEQTQGPRPGIVINNINYFSPFYGQINSGSFNNCSFIGFKRAFISYELNYNSNFTNCYFELKNDYSPFFRKISDINLCFENCIFDSAKDNYLSTYFHNNCNISMKNIWFGDNSISFSKPDQSNFYPNVVESNVMSVTRYAIFNLTQNYLGNNQYEIIGKLTWNGTEGQDGMENFQPMTVTLESENGGEIASTVTLVNGTFKTIYKNSASSHHITATLHNQDIDLEFTTVNITANPVSIYYGDDQNVTLTFTQPVTANVTVSVYNESYRKNYTVEVINKDSITYTIPDTLKAGTYTINVTLADNGLYGSNSTELKISKVVIDNFDPELPGENPKVGDDVTISIELPNDVTGTVTVYVNNKPFTEEASPNTEVTVNGLIAGDNNITVEYSGNDKYEAKSLNQTITAEKVSSYTLDVVVPTGVKVGEDTNITIKLPGDVSGNALVYVGSQNPINVPVSGESTVVSVSGLVAGNNTVKVVFGDDKYAEKTVIKNITVEKVPVEITNNTIVVNAPSDSATPTVSINISGATGNLTVIINNKTFTEKLENGTATVTIKDVPAGTYNATVIYSGDDTFNQITTTANITVSEPKKQDNNTNTGGQTNKVTKVATKIVAKKKTFKAKKKVKKYTITLKTKAGKAVKKVTVTLKIKGKTYKAKTNAKGKATFKIKKLTKKGKHTAVIKFKGNKNFKASSKKVKITIKK